MKNYSFLNSGSDRALRNLAVPFHQTPHMRPRFHFHEQDRSQFRLDKCLLYYKFCENLEKSLQKPGNNRQKPVITNFHIF